MYDPAECYAQGTVNSSLHWDVERAYQVYVIMISM